MSNATVNVPAFDPALRAPFYQEVMVQLDNVDPVTGINTGTPDTTAALDFTIQSQPHATPVVSITQVGIVPDGQTNAGARILRIAPGVLQVTDPAFTWTVVCKVHGAPSTANLILFNGTTPPPPTLSGVVPVGGILTTQP